MQPLHRDTYVNAHRTYPADVDPRRLIRVGAGWWEIGCRECEEDREPPFVVTEEDS